MDLLAQLATEANVADFDDVVMEGRACERVGQAEADFTADDDDVGGAFEARGTKNGEAPDDDNRDMAVGPGRQSINIQWVWVARNTPKSTKNPGFRPTENHQNLDFLVIRLNF